MNHTPIGPIRPICPSGPSPCARAAWTALSDDQLLAQCEVDTYRASGPGGQKRNKTSSAVRLRHPPTGLLVIAEESRSQHENKAKALRRLRRALFLDLREPAAGRRSPTHPDFAPARGADGRLHLSAKDPRFWPAAGVVLDVLAAVRSPRRRCRRTPGHIDRQPDRLPPDRPETLAGGQPTARSAGQKPLR